MERNLEKENFRSPSSRIAAENGICQTSAAALPYKLTYTYTHIHIDSASVRAVQKCECNARNSTVVSLLEWPRGQLSAYTGFH